MPNQKGMIRRSGRRFAEKIMPHRDDGSIAMAVDDRHRGGDRNRYRNPYRGRGGPGFDADEFRPDPLFGIAAVPDRGGFGGLRPLAGRFPPLGGPVPGGGRYRGRGPRAYRRSAERIREDVSDRLTDDHEVDASRIEVAVSGGEVRLSGSVDSRAAKRRAEDIAWSVAGVTQVQNDLRVEPLEATRTTGGVPVP
jgi:hypothetical protein